MSQTRFTNQGGNSTYESAQQPHQTNNVTRVDKNAQPTPKDTGYQTNKSSSTAL